MSGKIRVCHIVSGDLWGGAEAQVFALLGELVKSEHLSIHAISLNHGDLENKLRAIGVEIKVVDETKESALTLIRYIHRELTRQHSRIIHTHGFKETLLGGCAGRLRGLSLVRTHHGKGVLNGTFLQRTIEGLNRRWFTDISIAVSADLEQRLIEYGYISKSIRVIRNGITCEKSRLHRDREQLRAQYGIQANVNVICSIGRLVPIKGFEYLLEGAKNVLQSCPDVIFLLAGDGPLLELLKDKALSLGLHDHVRFMGFTNCPEDILCLSDIFALMSLHEGIPMVLLEAMRAAKPIIATNVGGIPEIIKDDENGILVPAENPEVFAAACCRLLKDTNLRDRLSHNGLTTVTDRFDVKQVAKAVLQVYREL